MKKQFIITMLFLFVVTWESKSANFDSSTIEVLEIQTMYDFVVVKDTVVSSTHHYIPQYRFWYIKGIDGNDYISDKLPKIIKEKK